MRALKEIAGARVEEHEPLPPEFAEEALALRFAEQHATDLRYVAAWDKWFRWTGRRWEDERTLYAFDLARKLCRAESARCNKESVARGLASAKTVAAVQRLGRADRRLAATMEHWDADPWLLNTPGGVVDLRTGRIRPAKFDDYMTKITAVAPQGDCRLWERFLEQITDGNRDQLDFMQRIFGYALTGLTTEHAMFFFHGVGSNGKSVTLRTVAGVMADYHRVAAIETFTATANDRHPADIAALRGARLVTASETEDGRRWAESKLKMLTGGDPVSARFMRQDWFEFLPQFTLVFSGNHKPGLRTVNVAIRRRLYLVPFSVIIRADQQDKDLADKLRAEWPGILAWMIRGCLAWQQRGLDPPESVTRATDDYLDGEDSIGGWIEDRCELGSTFFSGTRELFTDWKEWAEAGEEYVGSERGFAMKLQDRQFKSDRVRDVRGFWGLRLRAVV